MKDMYFCGVQHFFDIEPKINEQLHFEFPQANEKYGTNEYHISLLKHKKEVKNSLYKIFAELKNCTLNLFSVNSPWYKKLVSLEEEIISEYDSCEFDKGKLKNFYFKRMGNIDYVFLNNIRKSCVGYSKTIEDTPVNDVYSIKEYIFMLKAYIINNCSIIQNIQIIDAKNNDLGRLIDYRGDSSRLSDMLFWHFPTRLNFGKTDIVSINSSNVIFMIKNGEHAITINVNIGKNEALISYFIPEVYSVGLVNSLPGIDAKVTRNDDWASGSFICSLDLFTDTLFTLISKFPRDEEEILYDSISRVL